MGPYGISADYWKSNARKYCDFCKCWIADNKPSVEFHEKGRRHQDNVAKKLKFISKKSRRDEKESNKTDAILKQMESAAMEAYRKDVENNADLSSIVINKKLEDGNLALSGPSKDCVKKVWREARGPQGGIYYWNTVTNESAWEVPKEGYLSLAEQRKQMDEVTMQQMKTVDKQRKIDARIQHEEQKKEEMEAKAAAMREKMKERRVEPEPEIAVSGPILPAGKTEPYGQWQKVVAATTSVDLQLPKQEYEYFEVPVGQYEPPPPREFKEKTVESLGKGNAMFKKRKFVSSAKKNSRQRLDND